MARIQGNENDAAETSVRKLDTARQLDGRLSGGAANQRSADEEVVFDCVDVDAKVLPIADIDSRRPRASGARPDDPIRVKYGDLNRRSFEGVLLIGPADQIESRRIPCIRV